MSRLRVWPRPLDAEHVGGLFDDDKASLGERLLELRSKVLELARLQVLPRALATDGVRQTVKAGFHEDEVAVTLVHGAGDAILHLMPATRFR